ncbi:MAG: hypothetical protein H0V51_03945, partial [Chloroflexi bacterium]|nr:hypothetical protein [Chloroflexota bacterium]
PAEALKPAEAPKPTAAPAAAAPAKPGATLVAAGESIGDNYDPSVSFQGWSHAWTAANLFDTLVDSRDGKISPALATQWSTSPDRLTYTFKLRPNVKFHDGTPFDAEAVAFNYMRQIDDKHPSYQAQSITRGVTLVGVTKVEATGPLEVTFTRSRPSVAMLAQLALPWAGIMSPTAIQKFGADYGRSPVGTGPFVFEKGAKGDEASMTAFPDYWGTKPSVGRVVIRAIPDLSSVNAALLAGEVDLTQNVDFKDLAAHRRNSRLKVEVVPGASYGYLAVNNQAPNLKDVRVRRALAHAIDSRQIIDVILYGEAEPPAGFLTPPVPGYAKELLNYYPYDQAKARALLAEAGMADLALNLWAPSNGFWPGMAELMQAELAKVGVKISVEKIDPARFGGQVSEGKHDLFIWDGSQSSADPGELMNSFFLSSNPRSMGRYGFNNKEFDDLVAAQDAEADEAKRQPILLQAQKLLLDQVPQVFLYHGRFATVMSSRVQGFKTLPFRHAVYFNGITLS